MYIFSPIKNLQKEIMDHSLLVNLKIYYIIQQHRCWVGRIYILQGDLKKYRFPEANPGESDSVGLGRGLGIFIFKNSLVILMCTLLGTTGNN